MAVDRRALADPRFLLAIGVLAVNDHWAKAAHANWLTGKLSDLAGLLVVGVLVRLALGPRARGRLGLVALGLAFGLLKTVPAATAAAIVAADAVLPWSNAIVTDPTDLLTLPVLLAVGPIVERPVVWWTARSARVAGLVLAASTAVATSYEPPYGDDLTIDESGDIVGYPYSGFESAGEFATEACRPAAPAECWRISDLTIEETTDGGATWTIVWQVDPEAAATLRAEPVDAVHPDDFGPRDIVATDTAVVASFDGLHTMVERRPDGTWSPAPRDFRAIPRAAAALQGIVVVLAGTTLAATAVRWRRGLAGWLVLSLVVVASLAVALGIGLGAMRSAAGVFPLEAFLAVPLLPLLIACGLAVMEPTRLWSSLAVGGRSALVVALLAGLMLPPLPLLRWSATDAPGYATATLLSVAIAAACALATFAIAAVFTPASTAPPTEM